MKHMKLMKDICIVLAAVIAVQIVVISARALDNLTSPDNTKQMAEPAVYYTTAPAEEELPLETMAAVQTEPAPSALEETAPGQTAPGETAPEETAPEETAPAETVPPETAPEETVPAETAETEPEEKPLGKPLKNVKSVSWEIHEIPLYYQTDYPDVMYGSGTIATSGCSITSLAMVATYLTDHVYMPDELADYFGGGANNNIDRLEYAIEELKLPYEGPLNFHETLQALKEGKVAIALMNENSILTNSQHFVVMPGFNEDGKIVVLDPYEPNYSHWQLKNALVSGFKPGDLSGGFDGGWVFDKEDMPEDPFIYEPEVHEGEKRYDFDLTDAEKTLLASMIWVEAQGETLKGQQAVAEVVLNRLAADNFQDTLRGVIYADGQFLSTAKLHDAEPTQMQYDVVERALNGPYILPEDVVFFATFAVNKNIWGVIGGHVFCHQW